MGFEGFFSDFCRRDYEGWDLSELQEDDGAEFVGQATETEVGMAAYLVEVADQGKFWWGWWEIDGFFLGFRFEFGN